MTNDPSSVQAAFEQFILRMPWPDASLEPDSTFSTWGFLEVASKAFHAGAAYKEGELQAVIDKLEGRCKRLKDQLVVWERDYSEWLNTYYDWQDTYDLLDLEDDDSEE